MADTLVNPDVEMTLLGNLLHDNAQIDRVADILEPHDFADPVLANIFAAIVREGMAGKSVNPITLRPYFENDEGVKALGGAAFLMRLGAEAGMIASTTLAAQIFELAKRRAMRAGLATASEACGDMTVPLGEIVTHADAAISMTAKDQIHQPSGGQCFDELLRGLDDKRSGVTCGHIEQLDELLGPMRPKQLVIGAGRPGMGKTALALSYALGAAQRGHGVLYVSLEMSSVELAARMASDMCFDSRMQIPFSRIRDGRLSKDERRHLAEAAQRMHQSPFQVVDVGSLNIGRLNMLVRRHARAMAAKGFSLDLVIVDYLQLLSPDSKGRSTYEAVSEVSRGLKALAKDNELAVFALAQLSRTVETRPDKRPQLSDLRDSGQIEQDADAVLFLVRQEYYLRQNEPEQGDAKRIEWEQALEAVQGQIEFIVAKRRNGVTGSAKGAFHGAYQAVRGIA